MPARVHRLPCEREVAAQPSEGFHPAAKPPHHPSLPKHQAAPIDKAGRRLQRPLASPKKHHPPEPTASLVKGRWRQSRWRDSAPQRSRRTALPSPSSIHQQSGQAPKNPPAFHKKRRPPKRFRSAAKPPRHPSIAKHQAAPIKKRASASALARFPQKAPPAGTHSLPCEREVAAQPSEGFHPTAKPPRHPSLHKHQAASINKAGRRPSTHPLSKNAVRRKDSPATSPRQPEVFSLHPVTKRASASSTRPLPQCITRWSPMPPL